jgi:hypothetical protein
MFASFEVKTRQPFEQPFETIERGRKASFVKLLLRC